MSLQSLEAYLWSASEFDASGSGMLKTTHFSCGVPYLPALELHLLQQMKRLSEAEVSLHFVTLASTPET